jgi:hypothetical protein
VNPANYSASCAPYKKIHFDTTLTKIMRLRYNPFFGYLQSRVEQEIDKLLESGSG